MNAADLTREQKLNLIYRHTHKDFKGNINGEKSIMVMRKGVTTLIGLSNMDEFEIAAHLPLALKKEADRLAKKAVK